MHKLVFGSFLVLVAMFAFAPSAARAVTPVHVDIQSMTIEYRRNWDETVYHVNAVDDAGNPVTFGGFGAYFLPVFNGEVFSIPGTFPTDRFDNLGLSFGQVNTTASWQVFSGHSDPVNLWLTNTPRKPLQFTRTGSAGFHASFHYSTELGYEAYDDDVVLEGSYQLDLANAYWMSGRKLQFNRLFFDLKKPEN